MFLIGLSSCSKEQTVTPKSISYSIRAEHTNFDINGVHCFDIGCETQVLYEGQSVEVEITSGPFKVPGTTNPYVYPTLLIIRGIDTVFFGYGPCKTTLKYGQ